jgi:hypothetical protein
MGPAFRQAADLARSMHQSLSVALMLRVVPERDEAIVQALASAWQKVRAEDPRVPPVTFYLTGGRPSSCATASWEEEQPVLRINLQDGGTNQTGAAIMAWLLHHAAHASAGSTAASEGRWHSEAYRDAALGLGLTVEKRPNGWARTSLARGTVTRYRAEIAAIDRAMRTWVPVIARKSGRAPEGLRCSCDPPRMIRASAGTATKGPITCGVCGKPFKPV